MKLLAIDTATEACSAALWLDGRLITREDEFDRGHAEHILPMVDQVLAEAGLTLRALDALAVGRGPGGFTGVRLGVSVAQGLAFGSDLPVVPVSDLRAVAQRAFDIEANAARVLVCNDARMQEVYWACFERGPDGLAQLAGAEHVSAPAAVTLPPDWLPGSGNARAPVCAIGRGFRAYPQLRDLAGPGAVVLEQLLPRAAEIARLAVPEVLAGRAVPAEEALPVYLRDDVARPKATGP
jgi:tRNA threonylcarbamoyladenosine biosynthesis protein TsaB